MTDKYAVIGNPVEHSLSPLVHAEFAKQTKQDLTYEKLLAPKDEFKKSVFAFRATGGKGLNITLPFKEQAWQLANTLSDRAKKAKAVNTFVFKDNEIIGDNTDGIGLVRDIKENHHIVFKHKRVLLLGAGGAARGAIAPILDEKPAFFMIANRTFDKAMQLVKEFKMHAGVAACAFSDLSSHQFDIIINATSASLKNQVLNIPEAMVTKTTCCYDMVFGKKNNPFLAWAKNAGTNFYFDGLGMLVEQAAESFYLWRQVRPKTKPVILKLQNL